MKMVSRSRWSTVPPVVYEIEDELDGEKRRVHVSRIKEYHGAAPITLLKGSLRLPA